MQKELEITIEEINRLGWQWWQEKQREEECEVEENEPDRNEVIIIQM
jgi:hypothetical protein